ncbi:hypothetical protein [Methanolacinia paynteri]|uniref:hypothetical protein n=1 Tax=Methanolacinia paynteri TaxID=230356 RepID=UPI00064EC698|nr:hypothetical protein [Methanolacinia paynteri]
MQSDDFELYLSKDIVQGEKVPFYILWDCNDVSKIELDIDGFTEISEFHNVRDGFNSESNKLDITDLKTKNYLGGILNTVSSEDPFQPANLRVHLVKSDGSSIINEEKRILYSTILEISKIPEIIHIPFNEKPINIQLKGSTTVFIDINTEEGSEVKFELPKDIQNAIEKFIFSFMEGLEKLKESYSEYSKFIDVLLDVMKKSDRVSERQFIDYAENEFESFSPTEEFIEAFSLVIDNALSNSASLKDLYFRPLIEYFEASATDKGFLKSPFLGINLHKGRFKLKGRITYENILEKEGIIKKNHNYAVPFETIIECSNEGMVSLKDLIDIQRIEDG